MRLKTNNQTQTRKCKDCEWELDLSSFNSDGRIRKKTGLTGYKHVCKTCEVLRETTRQKLKGRTDHGKATQNVARWRQKNPIKERLRVSLRQRRLKLCTPPWMTKDQFRDIYLEAKLNGMNVDHIIPIKHDKVCGLHVPWNLQLLSKAENSRKSNQFNIV